MRIEHLAIWAHDLERLKHFYESYFGVTANEKYVNPKKQFESYFLSFESGARLEIMKRPDIPANQNDVHQQYLGLIHFAVSVGSKEKVGALTKKLADDGFEIVGKPRTTGDGYYESVVLDPEGNRIEITV